ncbi:MAG: hypothetical protein MJH09_03120 [Cetobacterium sp.]|nr:hypothetical protein [Cetobacterium sp.]
MAKEIRVTFTDKEQDLYDFINSKSSKASFLKDLARLEKNRQDSLTNIDYNKLANIVIEKLNVSNDKIDQNEKNKVNKFDSDKIDKDEKSKEDKLNIDNIINNMDFSDLD